MASDSNSIDAHLDDWIIITAGAGHVAKIEDVVFFDVKLLEKMVHAEDFIHTWGEGVDGSGATDFVFEVRGKLFAFFDDSFAFFVVGIPSVFVFGAGFLTEGGEGNLRKAVFDDFVTFFQLVFFPIAEFFGSSFDGFSDFFDLIVS